MAQSLNVFGPELWVIDGTDVTGTLGFRFPTRMAVVRLRAGSLWIWSPVALTPALRQEIGELGTVAHLVAPNSLHHTFLADWQQAFPTARVYAAPGLREVSRDIAFTDDLDDTAAPAWASEIDQVVMPSNRITTEVVFFHRLSGTVLFTDLIQQMAPQRFTGWRGIIARLDLMVAKEPSVPRKFRAAFADKPAARAALARILAWPAERLVIAHGAPISTNARAVVANAFRWLTRGQS